MISPTTDQAERESPDFSLLGGPLYGLWLRSPWARFPKKLLLLRSTIASVFAWLPLLVLSLVNGQAIGNANGVSFLADIVTHVRLLVALPCLIAAELVIDQRLRSTVKQFVARAIVEANDLPRFNAAIVSTRRLCDSRMAEVGLLILAYTLGYWVWRTHVALDQTSWYAVVRDSTWRLTPAGWWNTCVGLPIYQFVLFRWCLRLLLWWRFLWHVARLNLRLTPTHPDRAGGLGFLGTGVSAAFSPILFAQGAMAAGLIGDSILNEGAHLLDFKIPVLFLVVFLVSIILMPLTMFTPHLWRAKSRGRRDYGMLANRYAQEFDAKWIRSPIAGEPLLGAPDIQSLADMSNSYAVVQKMRLTPFSLETIVSLAVAVMAPLLLLTPTAVPLDKLVDYLIKTLL